MRTRILSIIAAVAIGASIVPAGATSAAEPTVGTQIFNLLCRSKDGAPVFTPYHIGRCQDARPKDGFEIETLVCEGLLGGTFETVDSATMARRVNWFCFHGPTSE